MPDKAIVAKITNIRKHPNADRLFLGTCLGHTIIVGTDAFEGEIGLFFQDGLQLSEAYGKANNLVGYTDPLTGEHKGGFFAKNLRVRAVRLRGEKSEAYFASLASLSFLEKLPQEIKDRQEGFEFNEVDGVEICRKYITPASQKAISGRQKQARKANEWFAKHYDTDHFRTHGSYIPIGSVLYITAKCHGTSGRFGHVLDNQPLKWWEKLLRRKPRLQFDYLLGTRNVVYNGFLVHKGTKFYGEEGFRYSTINALKDKLYKGEIIYYELVGYTEKGGLIMPAASTKSLKDKNLIKRYGDEMVYKYGCKPELAETRTKLLVYRITRVTDDGHPIDLSWPQVRYRCSQLGLQTVPDLAGPYVYDGNLEDFARLVEELADGPDPIDPSHIREGCVVRVECDRSTYFLKEKNFTFKVLEGIVKDQNEIDMEEIA